jgi:hypothetical protein
MIQLEGLYPYFVNWGVCLLHDEQAPHDPVGMRLAKHCRTLPVSLIEHSNNCIIATLRASTCGQLLRGRFTDKRKCVGRYVSEMV